MQNRDLRGRYAAKPKHGGKRDGAGRKAVGTTRVVSLTLPDEIWQKIDDSIAAEEARSVPDYLRKVLAE